MTIDDDRVLTFEEKPKTEGGWINGGFFLLSPSVGDLITTTLPSGSTSLCRCWRQMTNCARYFHHGFWQPMDTLRDDTLLEEDWASGTAKWKVW